MGLFRDNKTIIQIEHNMFNNPNWKEANQLAIYKHGWGFELGTNQEQIQQVAREGIKPGTGGLWVQCIDHSATLPPQKSLGLGDTSWTQ